MGKNSCISLSVMLDIEGFMSVVFLNVLFFDAVGFPTEDWKYYGT